MSYLAGGNPTNVFDDLLGGDTSLIPSGALTARKGVFATYPATTPKYATNNDSDWGLATMARLLVPVENSVAFTNFVATFSSPEARKLAQALASYSNKRGGIGYIDFLLGSAQESWQEKVQIVDVLSDNYVAYFFGSQPPVFTYTGTLLNSKQDDWRAAFTILYNDIIRGTQLARRRRSVTLAYDKMAVTGALVSFGQTLTAEMQLASQFQFQLLVKRIDVFRTINSKPTAASRTPLNFVNVSNLATQDVSYVAPKTIREVQSPTVQTEQRQGGSTEEVPEEEGSLI